MTATSGKAIPPPCVPSKYLALGFTLLQHVYDITTVLLFVSCYKVLIFIHLMSACINSWTKTKRIQLSEQVSFFAGSIHHPRGRHLDSTWEIPQWWGSFMVIHPGKVSLVAVSWELISRETNNQSVISMECLRSNVKRGWNERLKSHTSFSGRKHF